MSFDVIASSRAEQRSIKPWRHVADTGIQMGAIGLCLAFVGILGMFNQRPIIVGVLTLGYATLALIDITAGVLVARRGLFKAPGATLLGGAVAGAVAGALVALLPALMLVANLRFIFVALDTPLLRMLTLGLKPAVLALPLHVAFGAGLGFVGALLVILPLTARRPVAAGLIAAGLGGLFQELLRPILINSATTKPIADLLYTWTGLTMQGAIIISVVTAIGVWVWYKFRDRVTARFEALPAKTRRNIRWGYITLACAVGALFPLYAGNFVGQVFLMVGLFILMGMGLNLEVGLAGLLDLGFVAFYAVGAYATALLTADDSFALVSPGLSYWIAMPIAVFCSIVMGVLFGIPVLKVRGDYLAVATLGLGEIVRVVVLSDAAAPLLAGAKGILQIPRPQLLGYSFDTPVALFYLTLVASLVAAYCAWRLEDSRLGRAWMAIRDDEDVAQALGINLIQVKLLAYGLGAAFAGLAGSIFAVMLGSIYPHSFQLIISINILALIIVGGMGSLPGVALGALVLIGLPEMLREFGEYRFLFYGLAIVGVMRVKPEGLWPSQAKRREMQIDAETLAFQQAAGQQQEKT